MIHERTHESGFDEALDRENLRADLRIDRLDRKISNQKAILEKYENEIEDIKSAYDSTNSSSLMDTTIRRLEESRAFEDKLEQTKCLIIKSEKAVKHMISSSHESITQETL